MADFYGSHFEYGGISSRTYGLIIANIETSRFTKLSGTLEGSSVFNRITKKRFLVDEDYSNYPTSYEVDIVSDDDSIIGLQKRREIEKWLFNRQNYKKLYMDIADDCSGETIEIVDGIQKRLYINCRFVNPERLEYNGGIIGYKVTLEADSGMLWQDAVTKTYTFTNTTSASSNTITVNADTDMDDYLYPKVVIKTGSESGTIIITNTADDSTRLTKFTGLSQNAIITMNGELNYVSGQYYEKFNNRNFIRLLDGDNTFTITGDVTEISFEFSNRRAF